MLCPVQEVGRDVTGDGARDGELDDGKQDVKLSRIKRKQFFFWPDMLVASKKRTQCLYPGPSTWRSMIDKPASPSWVGSMLET